MDEERGMDQDDENSDGVTREDILYWIRCLVWSGENDVEEVALLVEAQMSDEDEFEEDWLDGEIRREFEGKLAAEKTWPEVTDCDRLDRAFEALGQRGIIALHMAGFTQTDGLDEVEDTYHEAGGESNYTGHCFYTEQDQEGALDGAGLYFGFGHLTGNDTKGVEVGQLVRSALEHEGFEVEWDGTIGRRLHVREFRWQRRSPR